jgi:hypothetical protein
MDLRAVGAGALWVLGLGMVLAAFSYASWWASFYKTGLRRALGRPAFTLPFDVGLALACAGFAVAGREWWEQGLWVALTALFAAQAGYTGWKAWQRPASPAPAGGPQPGSPT